MGYLVALGSQWILAVPPFVLSFVLPESPAYLVRKGNISAATKSLTRLFGPKNDPEKLLHKLQTSIEDEEKNASKISYAECFNSHNRRRTWIVIYANQLPNFFGLPLLSSVSYFLQQVGMKPSHSVIFLIGGIVLGLLSNAASTWTLSNIGRRKLTITTLLIAGGIWLAMGMIGIKRSAITPWLTAACSTLVVVTCGLGAWPASYTIMSESSSLRLRAKSQAIGGISNYISTVAVNFALPYVYNPDAANLGAKTGFVFAALCAGGAVLMWWLVPEMRGRSVVEIDRLFEQGVGARGSSRWKDRSGEVVLEEVRV
ncbi:general substrate transporter [Aaosphaeria arxii CBS 175.79]|uniref:General substrate transporter n=1 Tax=Aaosphaeria arxii CBS 175.79 TaxID=1450172 RepID=A0A6A5XJZ6_9PLEO|nr:general substrate transporter [Aaosphaeria arxii CBS 175.79]KAF2013452.1 general substrate transporter [Aaosphaeria arxii CBS 175.79]